MFGRKKDDAPVDQAPQDRTGSSAVRPGAKNRPTPSRREAEAARRRPVVPADRKAAAQQSKIKEREARLKTREAMLSGEEWALPARDQGRQRQFIRDVVDSRWSIGEFLLPIMIIGLPISLIQNSTAVMIGYTLVYGALIATLLDTVFLTMRLKKQIRERFGEEPARGTGWYVFSRSVQIRPGRMPRPRVKRGESPR
ncbi:DUF3043 domain-containing protein [Gephyromycinifex aptenodytis]|uniref:DUF3043 domain-containing protein n=1 Tax=Gephyromycinifex aptenodytis TaxID=2716227 RepID=UPI001446E839|nr:DUF3043 domain-containing protein [Gephyromycinifex aptenodytis]